MPPPSSSGRWRVDGDALFFGTGDRWFYRLEIGAARPKWRVRLGGFAAAEPVVLEGRLYLPATNSVLYCLRGSGGDVIWWANIPSRTPYDLAMADGKVIAASLSERLPAFDAATGKPEGAFKAGKDLATNAVWVDPLIVVVQYDVATDQGKVVFLRKDVQVVLSAKKASPQPAGEEIPFTVSVVGFFTCPDTSSMSSPGTSARSSRRPPRKAPGRGSRRPKAAISSASR